VPSGKKARAVATAQPKPAPELSPRFRVRRGGQIALGPGKVELLLNIGETGSIAEAARRMGMSYMRAWTLIKVMNRAFNQPLVTALRGGKEGGGAELTPAGTKAARLYRKMESAALRGAGPAWRELKTLLRD
jgi:molybdate transport system regulatory protein